MLNTIVSELQTYNVHTVLYINISIFISILCGVSIRYALSFCDQNWVQTYQHTVSYALLPPITFVITKVISGNIALSLGMIGALSIVRFRTPVKNPLELIIYFALITIGISCSVRVAYGIFLTITIITVLLFLKFLSTYLSKRFNYEIPSLIYGDGNHYNTIEVSCVKKIDEFKSKKELIQSIENNEDELFIYKFATKNTDETNKLNNHISNFDKHVKNIITDYNR
jgi:hypothetical protein